MRYRFEDTKYNADIKENNARPIAIERTSETHILQLIKNMSVDMINDSRKYGMDI